MSIDLRAIQKELDEYLEMFPEDTDALVPLLAQLKQSEDVFDRRNFSGHICGSGIVLSPDRQKVLLVHHKLFDRWQQPGGHAEATDAKVIAAAYREVMEETGISGARVIPVAGRTIPIHIGVHEVPSNPMKDEPAHTHYDFRYVFEAAEDALHAQETEVHGAAWVDIMDPRTAHITVPIARVRQYIHLRG